ncbi:MAG: hypothetical protein WC843_01980 [Candidatus Gracilibacteria bacterium]|jgi:hypothetical protein
MSELSPEQEDIATLNHSGIRTKEHTPTTSTEKIQNIIAVALFATGVIGTGYLMKKQYSEISDLADKGSCAAVRENCQRKLPDQISAKQARERITDCVEETSPQLNRIRTRKNLPPMNCQ